MKINVIPDVLVGTSFFNVPKNKRIGLIMLGGTHHKGHEVLLQKVKDISDFVVVVYRSITQGDVNSLIQKYYAACRNIDLAQANTDVPNRPYSIPDLDTQKWLEDSCDLLIIHEEITKPMQTFEIEVKDYVMNEVLPDGIWPDGITEHSKALARSSMIIQLIIDRHYFPVHVRGRSYKDGLHTFVMENRVKEVVGRDYLLIPPVREDDLVASTSWKLGIKQETKMALSKILLEDPLLNSKDVTKESLDYRLQPIGAEVKYFTKYSGPYLKYHTDEGDTYINVVIRFKDDVFTYSDAIIL